MTDEKKLSRQEFEEYLGLYLPEYKEQLEKLYKKQERSRFKEMVEEFIEKHKFVCCENDQPFYHFGQNDIDELLSKLGDEGRKSTPHKICQMTIRGMEVLKPLGITTDEEIEEYKKKLSKLSAEKDEPNSQVGKPEEESARHGSRPSVNDIITKEWDNKYDDEWNKEETDKCECKCHTKGQCWDCVEGGKCPKETGE